MGGKPDLIAVDGDEVTLLDVKTGQPKESDQIQVLTYMYALPLVFPEFKGNLMNGTVAYHHHQVPIRSDEVSESFKAKLVDLIRRLADDEPARRVPSTVKCGYCEIAKADCPDRADIGQSSEGQTSDF